MSKNGFHIKARALRASNAAFRLPAVPGIDQHVKDMQDIAKTATVEHARVVDWKTGKTLWQSAGSDITVDLGKCQYLEGNLIIHTHPAPAELSEGDIVCTTVSQARANMAVCGDGTVSWAGPFDKRHCPGPFFVELVADRVRREYGWGGWHIATCEEARQYTREIARDNYFIARRFVAIGWVDEYYAHYSDKLIEKMADVEVE